MIKETMFFFRHGPATSRRQPKTPRRTRERRSTSLMEQANPYRSRTQASMLSSPRLSCAALHRWSKPSRSSNAY